MLPTCPLPHALRRLAVAPHPFLHTGCCGVSLSSTIWSRPFRSKTAMSATKLSQGELVQQCLKTSPVPLIDIGVNLVDDAFDKDRDAVLRRAGQAGVEAIIVTGCSVQSSRKARDLCDALAAASSTQAAANGDDGAAPLPQLYFTAGVHPHTAKECNEETIQQLEELAAHPHCVAIGECGLDFNRNFSPPDVQERWFDAQVALATRLRKPLFMHCRDASAKFASILGAHGDRGGAPGVLHCFTGNGHELKECLELGLCIGITGWVCDDRPERGGAELAALLPSIPADRLMIETDAPYLAPRSIKPAKARPHRCEPALLPHVLAKVAEALGQSEEEVAARTTAVAKRVFGLHSETALAHVQ